jgi:hypothetical protein
MDPELEADDSDFPQHRSSGLTAVSVRSGLGTRDGLKLPVGRSVACHVESCAEDTVESARCKVQMTGTAAMHNRAIAQKPAGPKRL